MSLSVLLVAAFAARAGPVVDQEQADLLNANQNVFNGNVLAQTFTVGFTGSLTQAALYLTREPGAPTDILLTLQVRNTVTGLPGTTTLGATGIPCASVPESGGFVPVAFVPPIPVVRGQVLALVLLSSQIWTPGALYGTQVGHPDPYPNGTAFDSVDGTTWHEITDGVQPFDRAFLTWVDPYSPMDIGAELDSLIDDLAGVVAANSAEKWSKKVESARKSAVKALGEWDSVPTDHSGALKALEKVVKSIVGAGSKGFADAYLYEERAALISLAIATKALELAIGAPGDPGLIATAQSQIDAGNVELLAGDCLGATDLYEKSGKSASKAY